MLVTQAYVFHCQFKLLSNAVSNYNTYFFPALVFQPVHLAQASFQLEAFGSRFILDLILNK